MDTYTKQTTQIFPHILVPIHHLVAVIQSLQGYGYKYIQPPRQEICPYVKALLTLIADNSNVRNWMCHWYVLMIYVHNLLAAPMAGND